MLSITPGLQCPKAMFRAALQNKLTAGTVSVQLHL